MKPKKKLDLDNMILNKEERDFLDSFENNEWKSVRQLGQKKALAKKAATNYLRKNARINIRLSSSDLVQIKQIAAYEGIPYQTLIASILHKYAAGHLNNEERKT